MMTLNTPQTVPLCSGFGQYHTDNPNSPAQKPYKTITYDGIVKMVGKPPKKDKKNAQWFIPSDALTREAQKQREQGRFYAVWCDFDEHTLQESIQAVLASLWCSHIIYSSRSATPEYQKWRVIIPLAAPSTANQFEQVAAIINDKFEAAGIVPDRASERCNQICYLPNQGEFYHFHIETAYPPLDWQHALADELAEKQRQAEQEQTAKNEQRERSRQNAITRMATDNLSPIDAYNGAYPVEQSLEFYGYKRVGKRYLSPNSESGQAGVTIENGKWFSSHGSDSGIGKPCTNGGTMGDAFDLFTYYEHNGDRNAATKAAGAMFTVGGATLTQHNQREYAKHTSQAKESMKAQQRNKPQQSATIINLSGGGEPSTSLSFTDGDFLADNAKAPDFFINDILESDSHGILFGESMAFKTFCALKMVHCICTGSAFFGHDVFRTGKVLYICGEGKGALSRRIKALKIVEGDFQGNLMILDVLLGIDAHIPMLELKKLIDDTRPVLVVIDTFSSLATATDENDNSGVAKALALIKETCSNGLTSSMLIHHCGKDSTKGARGAYAFKGNVDFLMEMTRFMDTMEATLTSVKMKDGDKFQPIACKAQIVELGLTRQDGKESTSLVLKSSDYIPTKKSDKQLNPTELEIWGALLKSLNDHGITPPQNIIARFPDSPQNCPKKVVHIDDFRRLAYPFLNVKQNSKRTVLQRVITKFKLSYKTMFYDDYLWIIQ